MIRLEGIRIKNFMSLKDVTLGRTRSNPSGEPLSSITAVVGGNDVGRHNLRRAFGFFRDCLKYDVKHACSVLGGFHKICTWDNLDEPISFEICYYVPVDPSVKDPSTITYEFSIHMKTIDTVPHVVMERLSSTDCNGDHVRLLDFSGGSGVVGSPGKKADLVDDYVLAAKIFGLFSGNPDICDLVTSIEGWHLSDLDISLMRRPSTRVSYSQLTERGENIANVLDLMTDEQILFNLVFNLRETFNHVRTISTEYDLGLLIRFDFSDSHGIFYANNVSSSILKMLAYNVLLFEMNNRWKSNRGRDLFLFDDIELGLSAENFNRIINKFRNASHLAGTDYDDRRPQVFIITTEQSIANILDPSETWRIERDSDGCSVINRFDER